MEDVFDFLGVISLAILLVIFSPLINFGLAFFIGWLIKITFGAVFCQGLALLGINISPAMIPLFCGTMGVISSFFKSAVSFKKADKKAS